MALLLVTVLSMVASELVPKNVAIARADAAAGILARPVLAYGAVFGPLIRLLNAAANGTVRRFGIEPREELTAVRSLQELELLIRSSGEGGTLDADALTLLTRTLRFNDKTAADALVPRTSVTAVSPDDSIAELVAASMATGFSRFPVCRDDLDDVVGTVHVKDVYRLPIDQRASARVAAVMAEPFIVPESRDLEVGARRPPDRQPPRGRRRRVRRHGRHHHHGGRARGDRRRHRRRARPAQAPRRSCRSAPTSCPARCTPTRWPRPAASRFPTASTRRWPGFVLERLGRVPEGGERFVHLGWVIEVARDGPAPDRDRAPDRSGAGIEAMSPWFLLVAVVLLFANGYFVAVEFAVIASRRTKLEELAAEGAGAARLALEATQHLSLQLAGAQLGITMASLGLGAVAEPTLGGLLERVLGVGDVLPDGRAAQHRPRPRARHRRLRPHGVRGDGPEERHAGRSRAHARAARHPEPHLPRACSDRS